MFIEKLGPHNIQTYTEMVQRAQLVEDTMAKVEGMRGKDISKPTFIKRGAVNTTGTFPNNNSNNYNNNKRPTPGKDYGMKKKIEVEETMTVEYCKFCNKPRHQADKCWKKVGACLRCGSHEHHIPNCPMLKDQAGRNQGVLKRQGCVNAVTQAELPEGAGGVGDPHTKPFFFPFSSAVTCTNCPLEVDQRKGDIHMINSKPQPPCFPSVALRPPPPPHPFAGRTATAGGHVICLPVIHNLRITPGLEAGSETEEDDLLERHNAWVVGLCGPRILAQNAPWLSACEHDRAGRRILNVTVLGVTFMSPLFGVVRLHARRVARTGHTAGIKDDKEMTYTVMDLGVTFRMRQPDPSRSASERAISRCRVLKATEDPFLGFVVVERQLDLSSMAVRLRVACEAHLYPFQVRKSRRLPTLRLVRNRTAVELGLYHQQCNLYFLFTSGDEKFEKVMKGFTICLVGALLFPSIENILEEENMSAVCGIWEGERLGPTVLAYLYIGLTAASLDSLVGLEGQIANHVPQLKTRIDWHDHLQSMPQNAFTCIPKPLLTKDLQTRLAPGVEIRLIGATEFMLYNAHRYFSQLGLPSHIFEGPSHLPSIMKRELRTNGDGEEIDKIKALWKI
ncbi:hypothetical protein Taro_052295 [Colocasia esculenta]|uniref:CCHC-type domain-containing protein n=1 Tax=Colocasia esculenta TaxID=4460 RepID=A0A843XI82_COLES|nr:hypothetical protein [Colocasia esculenta]